MDGGWTKAYATKPGPVQENTFPSDIKTALRQIGKQKAKDIRGNDALGRTQTKIPVVQQGTGPFENETDPSSYPQLDTHRDQNGRLCLLISSVSVLFLGIGCIVTCFSGAGIFDSGLSSSCERFPLYWKHRCLPIDDTTAISAFDCDLKSWNAACCMQKCNMIENPIPVQGKRCIKKCAENFPNYENDLGIPQFQRTTYELFKVKKVQWGQQDPVTVCKATATWPGAVPVRKLDTVSDWHLAVSRACWGVGVISFVAATLGAGLFGLLGAVYTDFSLGVMIFQGISLAFFWLFWIVGALSFAAAAFWQDLWKTRMRPVCMEKDQSQLLYLTECLVNVPLCRFWEENYYFIFAIFIAIGIVFILAGTVMFFGAVYLIFYPVIQPKSVEWSTATFAPMVGPNETTAGLPLPQQAHRLHQTLTGRPGVLPLTYTIALPHKSVEELYQHGTQPTS